MSMSAIQNIPGTKPKRTAVWVMPAIVVSLMAALWGYIGSIRLDSIATRSLAPGVVFAALWQHVELVATSTLFTIAIGIPLGILLTRRRARRAGVAVLAAANAGQAVPSVGVLVILAMLFGVGFWMAVLALVLYALLPVLRNTMVGIQQVDPVLIDAGRGMGMSTLDVLRTIELPLAVPVMMAGIRVALILNVGVATLAAYTNAGGLGTIITAGISLDRMPVLIAGSVLTVVLALTVDWLAGIAERLARPRGI